MILSEIIQKYSLHSPHKVFVCSKETTLGNILAAADDEFMYMVSFEDSKHIEKSIKSMAKQLQCTFIEDNNKLLNRFVTELEKYFEGKLKNFTVPLKTFGSEFQKEVWTNLLSMPYSSTKTYGELAIAMGRSLSHSRAIGSACGANNHVIVIPCHRVVGSQSKGGFSCGMDRKEWLLNHEQKHRNT